MVAKKLTELMGLIIVAVTLVYALEHQRAPSQAPPAPPPAPDVKPKEPHRPDGPDDGRRRRPWRPRPADQESHDG